MAPAGCPDRETLAALAVGRLSGETLAAVAAHLDVCPACLARAQAATADTDPVVAALCRPDPANPYAREAGCDRAVARLRSHAETGAASDLPTVLAPGPGPLPAAPAGSAAGAGRYRPVRLHARGGLGEVHVALDEELSRQVALKRIQRPRAADPESRRRFVQEAEITARLEHPGVVPVYGLVRDGSGQPCYAMRLIQGETLQDAITRFHQEDRASRDPGERRLAMRDLLGRFVAVCNTVAYAHSRGVLHRDLKPANIMLGAYGETLVVDWGLAKAVGCGAVGPAAGAEATAGSGGADHTRTGQALGTPAYMSPEQAAGHAKAVGPAADVYSLGATLYAVLTGPPPSEGATADVSEQARPGKVPPRRSLKTDMPRPLEAVCRKAMALRPEDRYATALALATDVEHWLADEPVSVYRGGFAERSGRWARRHRTTVIAATAVGLATLLGVSLLAWQSEQGRRRLKLEQAATSQARREAEANARRERQAIRDYFVRAAEDPAWKAVGLESLRRKLLEEARTYLRGFLRTHGEDLDLLAELAEAHARLGGVIAELGDLQQACAETEAALALEKRMAAAQPREPRFRLHQARNWEALGRYWRDLGRGPGARQALEHAIDLAQGLVDGRPDEPEYLERLSSAHSNLGELLKDLGDDPAARRSHELGLALRERLVKLRKGVPGDQHKLALSCNDLGVLLRSRFGDLPGARQSYERASQILEDLVEHHPLVPEYRWDLAMTHNNLGVLYEHLGDRHRARTAHERSLELHRRLQAEHPQVPEYRRDLAMNHNNLGLFLKDEGDLAGARREIEQAVALREPLAQMYPNVPEYRQDLARCYKHLGVVLEDLEELPEAEQAIEKALSLQQQLAEQYPRPEYRSLLAGSYSVLGSVRGRRGDQAGRRRAHEKAAALSEQLVKEHPGVLQYALNLWESCFNLANLEREEGRLQAAVGWSSRAIDALGGDRRGKLDALARGYLSNTYRCRALDRARMDRHAEAVEDWDEAVALDDGSRRHVLLLERGLSLSQLGEHARAVGDAEEGIRSDNPTAEAHYAAAQIHAISADKVQRDTPGERTTHMTLARRNALALKYADRAMALLMQAVRSGYKDGTKLRTDKALDPLRARDDFQGLLQELDAAPKRP